MAEMAELLDRVIAEEASDLHIAVGRPPTLRLDGSLVHIGESPLEAEDTEKLVKSITSDENQQRVREKGGVDFGFSYGEQARFRVSVFRQKGVFGMALRLIPSRIMTLEEIGLPPGLKEILFRPRGLILVTGPTGSGKTTTLASMINIINHERDCHIITIEDPIEYYHGHSRSIVTQREVGVDVTTFKEALRMGLRADPDVILVGEMRDLETMSAAITAAETGHLVFATLHTTGAARTVDRIIDAFPKDQQGQIRTQLSLSILAVISQLLLVKASGKGRIAAFEIMIATPAIQNLIREGKSYRITSDIQTGSKYGMRTLDAGLVELFNRGIITYEDAVSKAQDPEQVLLQLRK
ncbi:MAG: type IV pilus twitching motility protein PilT [Candidatus Tritonobacter lacicola]|nr:type IV pilus twitching motility protein PilT [Candidatus Tritonobacter lacicola]